MKHIVALFLLFFAISLAVCWVQFTKDDALFEVNRDESSKIGSALLVNRRAEEKEKEALSTQNDDPVAGSSASSGQLVLSGNRENGGPNSNHTDDTNDRLIKTGFLYESVVFHNKYESSQINEQLRSKLQGAILNEFYAKASSEHMAFGGFECRGEVCKLSVVGSAKVLYEEQENEKTWWPAIVRTVKTPLDDGGVKLDFYLEEVK